jgi:hypothetical protein
MTTATLCMTAARKEFNGGSTHLVYEDEAIAEAFAKVYNTEDRIAQFKVSFQEPRAVTVRDRDGQVDVEASEAMTEKVYLALCGAVALA